MEPLTQRQVQILKNVIEEYISTAVPVGSDALDRKYDLGISPATIRNEMNTLSSLGYLRQPHTSAGRTPTPRALKFYVDQLMQEKQLSVADEVAAKQRVLESRANFDKLIQEATRALAELTKTLALAVTEDGRVWHSGYANILANPEFYNIDVTLHVLTFLEESGRVKDLLITHLVWSEPVEILFGEEMGWANFEPVGIIACRFNAVPVSGCLAIIGPTRLDYPVVIPMVRYFSALVSEAAQGL